MVRRQTSSLSAGVLGAVAGSRESGPGPVSSAGMPAMGLAEPCDWQSDTHCTYPLDYNSASSSMEDTGAPHECAEGGRMSSQDCGGVPPGGGLARGGL